MSQNYKGPTTPYGDPYHGYWVADATLLNDRFGTSNDFKSLSRELHNRGMSVIPLCSATAHHMLSPRYLMVDVVVNDVMATSIQPDLSTYMFKNEVRISHDLVPPILTCTSV